MAKPSRPVLSGSRRLRPATHLQVYRDLVAPQFADPTQLFAAGLRLLVERLEVDSAVMTRITSLGYEAIWWATRGDLAPGPEVHDPGRTYCPRALEGEPRTLVIRDAAKDHEYQDHTALKEFHIRAYIGVPMRTLAAPIGLLSVQNADAKAFTHGQVALVHLVANILGKAMEIELLKQELHSTREALDLTMSVMEDSALEAPATRLPSRFYLSVWLKAYLFMARRRSESLAVVLWTLPVNAETLPRLRRVADQARGEDLLVDLGRDSFALLLPRTSPQGAEVFLERVRAVLGPVAMGATLWHPGHPADLDDLAIRGALRRAGAALRRCRERPPAEWQRAEWVLPEAPELQPSTMKPCTSSSVTRPRPS